MVAPENLDFSLGPRPWDRQNGEKDSDWAMFSAFLHQSLPRNRAALAREFSRSEAHIYARSKYWRWLERVVAYDNMLQEAEDKVTIQGREELAREHLRALRKVRRLGEHSLDMALQQEQEAQASDDPQLSLFAVLGPKEALTYLKEAITLERLVTGDATERTENREIHDLSKLTSEEAEALAVILAKLEDK